MALIGNSLPEFGQEGEGRGLGSQASEEAGPGDCRTGSIYARAWSGTGGELESHRDSEISEVIVTK